MSETESPSVGRCFKNFSGAVVRGRFTLLGMPHAAALAPDDWEITDQPHQADAVVVTGPISKWPEIDHIVPVVSVTGTGEPWYDCITSDQDAALSRCAEIIERIRLLHRTVRQSADPTVLLLARLFTRALPLDAVHTPNLKSVVSYPLAGRIDKPVTLAEQLRERGLLGRNFFDRVHCCTSYGGSRFNVREECVACRSPDVVEEPIIHHYKCGHQARERAFRTATRFQCQKCGEALRHIGLDYDKPGLLVCCNACEHMTDAAAVGFRCLDCGAHIDTESVPTRDYYSYDLTARSVHFLQHGFEAQQPLGTLPNSFATLLRQSMAEQTCFGNSYVVMRLQISDKLEHDQTLWLRLKNLILDCLHSALREVDVVCEVADDFYLLLPRTPLRNLSRVQAQIVQRISEVLRVNLDPQFTVLSLQEQLVLLKG